jgi:predicted ArsR family transcriptional regulator
MMQLSIFTTPAARRTDPATSHAAARSAHALAADHNARILAALRQWGAMGKDGIAHRTGLSGVAVARRLTELERTGLVMLTGRTVESDTGRQEREWANAELTGSRSESGLNAGLGDERDKG